MTDREYELAEKVRVAIRLATDRSPRARSLPSGEPIFYDDVTPVLEGVMALRELLGLNQNWPAEGCRKMEEQ